jgi:hypothetical protein
MSVVIPSLRAAIAVPPWVKNELWRRARAVPSLDLRFADNKSLADAVSGQQLITFTRASSGTFVDSAGVIQTAATDVPRFDHDPITGESLGLLVEEQRTNNIRNNTMVGAVAGTPGTLPTNWSISGGGIGTLTQEVVAIGTSNGITYVDVKYSGTSSSTGFRIFHETAGQIAASTGQAWTGHVYAAILPGSTGLTSVNVAINERNSESTIVNIQSGTSYSTLSSTMTRLTVTIASAGATTASVQPEFNIVFPNTTAVNFTIRIGLPQLEQGAFATSVIPTTTAAATRSADVASITGSAFSGWYRQDAQTWYGEYAAIYTASNTIPANTPHLMQVYTAASANDNYAIRGAEPSIIQLAVARNPTSGVQFPGITLGFALAGQSRRLAYAINSTELQLAGMGLLGDLVTNNSAALMATHDILSIGNGTGGAAPNQVNGTIRRLTYWPTRLGNEVLQGITQ